MLSTDNRLVARFTRKKIHFFITKNFNKKTNQSILHLACGKKRIPVVIVAVLLKNSSKDAKLAKDTVSNYFLFTRL
jgi:hypothetical protein